MTFSLVQKVICPFVRVEGLENLFSEIEVSSLVSVSRLPLVSSSHLAIFLLSLSLCSLCSLLFGLFSIALPQHR